MKNEEQIKLLDNRLHRLLLIFIIAIAIMIIGCMIIRSNECRVAILGDSTVYHIAKELSAIYPDHYIFDDFAVLGDKSQNIAWRTLSKKTDRKKKLVDLNDYDVLIMKFGHNDSYKMTTIKSLKTIYKTAKKKGVDLVIYISTHPYQEHKSWSPSAWKTKQEVEEYIQKYKKNICDLYIDIIFECADWNNPNALNNQYTSDGLHFNKSGIRFLSKIIYEKWCPDD